MATCYKKSSRPSHSLYGDHSHSWQSGNVSRHLWAHSICMCGSLCIWLWGRFVLEKLPASMEPHQPKEFFCLSVHSEWTLADRPGKQRDLLWAATVWLCHQCCQQLQRPSCCHPLGKTATVRSPLRACAGLQGFWCWCFCQLRLLQRAAKKQPATLGCCEGNLSRTAGVPSVRTALPLLAFPRRLRELLALGSGSLIFCSWPQGIPEAVASFSFPCISPSLTCQTTCFPFSHRTGDLNSMATISGTNGKEAQTHGFSTLLAWITFPRHTIPTTQLLDKEASSGASGHVWRKAAEHSGGKLLID